MPRAYIPVRRTRIGLATTVLLMTAACGGQPTVGPAVPSKPRPAAPPTTYGSAPPNQEELDAAAGTIERLGASYSGSFTGLAVDNPGDRVIVYRKPDAAFDAALARLHSGVHVALQDAPRSISELASTRNRVEVLRGHTTGYTIMSVGDGSVASYTEGVVEVGVTGDLARARQELGARFGSGISVSPAEPVSVG